MVKAMLQRGDRHHDIAAWFGVNQGRIAEVKGGELFPDVGPAPSEDLPPQRSPGRIARISLRALEEAKESLTRATTAANRQAIEIIDSALNEIKETQ